MMKALGGNMSYPETNYNIALLLEPYHMLKLIGGALFTYKDIKNGNGLINNIINNILIYNTISNNIGQMISWKYFDLPHQYQKEIRLNLANKLIE